MNTSLIFVLGLFVGLIGVIPPGLLNMTAAKISLKEGHVRGIMFSIGASLVVIIQAGVAAFFARYLNNHPDVIDILQRVALVIFILVSIYYLKFANNEVTIDVDTEKRSKHSRFFQGVLLSIINLFPIPFHAYMTITMAGFGWIEFDYVSIGAYVAGAVCGTFVMLYFYIFFFDRYISKNLASQKNMNLIIGSITALVAVGTLVNIILKSI